MKHLPHTRISMAGHPELSEKWVQDLIAEDPSLLGLGDIDLKDVERRQPRAGRLDLLLSDADTSTRYEVELQLGATDETHIIRAIEYWDTERKRYPQYDHVAVIIAEEVTARFFNVISLFNGFIPIIAIQMSAIAVGDDGVTLVFTRVLDRTVLGTEEEDEGSPTDRKYWEAKATPEMVSLADQVLELVRQCDPGAELKYNKFYIGLLRNGSATTYVSIRPRKNKVNVEIRLPLTEEISDKIETAGLDTLPYDTKWSKYRLVLAPGDLIAHQGVLTELIALAKDRNDS